MDQKLNTTGRKADHDVRSINQLIEQSRQVRLTEKQFAAAVGLHHSTVARLRQAGRIQYRRAGRLVYYLAQDIEAFHQAMLRPTRSVSPALRRAG